MFGLMFGDIGHGAVIFIIGLFLVFFYDNRLSLFNEVKYLLLLMGFFSFYCGFVYNEFFAMPLVT